jgi:putative DNA primase/helicase
VNIDSPNDIKTSSVSTATNAIIGATKEYLALNLSVIPVDKDKRPLFSWNIYQNQLPTTEEISRWFRKNPSAVAVITGKISGCLEVLDIDCKYDLSGSLMEDFCELIKEHVPNLFPKLVIVQTINKGFHIVYRVAVKSIAGNKKIASRPATAEEEKNGDKVKVLIETRGEGGYFVAAPTPGYEFKQNDFSAIPLISRGEQETLVTLAGSFDQTTIKNLSSSEIRNVFPKTGDISPFDDFNARGDVPGLLKQNGWQYVYSRADRMFFKRPGTTDSKTSANFHTKLRVFYVFSTSTEFKSGSGYNPIGVYTILKHGGDFSAAGKVLLSEGFGTKINERVKLSVGTESKSEPKALPKISVCAPALSENLLPECWRVWLSDTSERLQCPIDYSAIAALVACAALIGNKIRLRPKQHDSWLVVPNLWGAVVGTPGMMKTPAVNEGLIFFREIAERERFTFEKKLETSEFEKEFSEAQKSTLKRSMAKAKASEKDRFQEQFQNLQTENPKEKRLWTADVTVEKLGELLNENPNGMLIMRDELTGWFRMLERPGHEQDRAFYLEAWNGEGSFTFDRIGRGKTHIKNLTVSVLGTIQPSMIEPYLRASLEGFGDDGLIQRFQLLVYPETTKNYRYVDRAPKGQDSARDSFNKIYAVTPENINARILTDDAGGYAFLQFDDEAQDFFKCWLTKLENDLRSGILPTTALESHLAKYRSLMPSLALIFHLLERVAGKTDSDAVELKSAQLAAAWCDYLQKHAEKLYSLAVLSDFDIAREILDRIKEHQLENEFTARDVYSNHWKKLSKPEEVKRGLEVLEDYGYLSVLENQTGGRSKITYSVRESLR